MTVQTWDLVSRCPVATLKGNMKEITGLECSACGSMLAIANRSVVHGESDDVQNCHYLVELHRADLPRRDEHAVELPPPALPGRQHPLLRKRERDGVGGSLSVSGRCLWDIRTQQQLSKMKPSHGCGSILDCRYCDESGELYAGSEHGDVFVWSG